MRAHNELPLGAWIGLRHDLHQWCMNCLRHEKPGNSIHENAVFKSWSQKASIHYSREQPFPKQRKSTYDKRFSVIISAFLKLRYGAFSNRRASFLYSLSYLFYWTRRVTTLSKPILVIIHKYLLTICKYLGIILTNMFTYVRIKYHLKILCRKRGGTEILWRDLY